MRAVVQQALSTATISSPVDGGSSLATLYVTGTAEPAFAVAVFLDGATTASCTTTATPHGTFACPLSGLSAGAHSLLVTVTNASAPDAAANGATSLALHFSVVAPTCAVSVALGTINTALTTGLKDAGAGLMPLSLPDGGASLPDGGISLTATRGANINWASYTPPVPTASLTAKGSTVNNLPSTYLDMTTSLPRTLSVDFGVTAAALSTAADDYQYLVAVSGQGQEGPSVTDTFSVALTVLGNANTFNTGLYSLLDGQPSTTLGRTGTAVSTNPANLTLASGHTFFTLPKATRQFNVVLTGGDDPHGIIFGALRLSGGCTPITVATPAPGATIGTASPAIAGTCEAGASVTVTEGGTTLCTATCSAQGLFSCAPGTPLAAAAHTVTATQRDAVGLESFPATRSFSVDTTTPAAPSLLTPAASATTSPFPTFSGTAEPGSTVRVFVDGVGTPICTAVASAAGDFQCVGTAGLAAGPHQAVATATDAAGNTGPSTAARPFTVPAPSTPVITTPAPGAVTSDATPTIAGTAPPASTVDVSVDGSPACHALADATGAFSCDVSPALAEGSHSVVATATTVAGTSGPSSAVAFTVDLTAPAAPLITSPTARATTGAQPTISGTAEIGATVSVFLDGSSSPLCTASVDARGNWTCAAPSSLAVGEHGVLATARDRAGNSSPPSATVSFTVLGVPRTPVLETPASGSSTVDPTPLFSGSAEPSSRVTVKVDGAAVCTTDADPAGHFECTPTQALAGGSHQATAASETAGGSAISAPSVFTVATAPAGSPPVVTAPAAGEATTASPTVEGTAEPGSTVSVLVDGTVVCTTTVATDGSWSCAPSEPLPVGQHTVAARAVDTGGAESASQPVSFRVATMGITGRGLGCSSTSGGPVWLGLALGLGLLARRSRRAVVVASVLLVAAAGQAQTSLPAFELERLRLNPSARGGLFVGSADLLERLEYRIALTGHYEHTPLVLTQDGAVVRSLVANRLGAHLSFALGLTRWLELGLQLPVVLLQRGDEVASFGVRSVSRSVAVGTPWVQLRVAPFQQSQGAPLDVAVGAMLGLPIGSAASLTSDSSFSVLPAVSLGRDLSLHDGTRLVRVGGEASLLIRPTRTLSVAGAEVGGLGNQLSIGLLVSTLGAGLRGELSGRLDVPLVSGGVAGELLGGVRYPLLGLLELYAAGGPGFGRAPGTPTFRVLAGLALSPRASRCVDGDREPVEACPQLDRDGDGVANGKDACPLEPGPAGLNGCPDRDSDGDGIMDSKDACATEPGVAERDGCPEPDTDGDGFVDSKDACPEQPAVGSARGCLDSDGDGLDDGEDKCPDVAGEKELGGCPDVDSDGDGVVDRFDACRTEKGPASNGGCPIKEKQLVVITREKLIIREKVFFATGKSKVLPRSAKLLSQVARVLKEHPEVAAVAIEGHTDSRGNHEQNIALSQARAEEVRGWLVGLGIDASRLEARGYGPDQPVETNDTEAGREANRRVEFTILGAEKPAEELDLSH